MFRLRKLGFGLGLVAQNLHPRNDNAFDLISVEFKFQQELLDLSFIGLVLYACLGTSDYPT